MDITIKRAIKEAGFSDVWYAAPTVGDELTAAQAYALVPVVRRAVDLLSNAVQSIPRGVKQGEEEVLDAEPMDFGPTLNLLATDAIIFGAYYAKLDMAGGRVKITRILPSTVTWVYTRGELDYFQRSTQQGIEKYKPDDRRFVWFWEQNFESEHGPGKSLLTSALIDANLIWSGSRFSTAWYRRGGPVTLLDVDPNTRPEELERIQSWWDRVTRGFKAWYKGIAVRAGLIKPIVIGSDGKAGDIANITKGAEERVLAALGVPPSMVFANAANYATAQQDAMNLISNSAYPFAQRLIAPFQIKVFWPAGLELELHPKSLPAFAQANLQFVSTAQQAITAQLMTLQYAQEMLGLPVTPKRVTPMPQAPTPTPPAEVASMAVLGELKNWRDYAVKNFGKPCRPWKAQAIAPADAERIAAQLQQARTAGDIDAIFAQQTLHPDERLAIAIEKATAALGSGV